MEVVKLSKNCIIPVDNILYVTDLSSKPIINTVKEKKSKKKCLNLSGRYKSTSVIFLKDGSIILTNTTMETILARMKGDN